MIKNIVIYLCLLIFALCFNIFYYAWFSWFLLVTVIALPLVSLAVSLPFMILSARRGVTLCVADEAEAGESVSITARGKRGGIAFCPLFRAKLRVAFLPDGKTKRLKFSFSGTMLKPAVKNYKALAEHCRQAELSVKWAKIYDFLGIFFIPVRLGARFSVCVLPCAQMPKLLPDVNSVVVTGYKPVPLGSSDIYDLREYRSGDSIRSIHWKLSSKTDDLIIRESVEPVMKTVVVRPAPAENAAENDEILSKLRYVCEYMISKTGVCHAANYGGEIIGLESGADVKKYFSALYRGESLGTCPAEVGEKQFYTIFAHHEEVSAD